jgi:catechol 2,3-dioxygenase-like lactoylglutathione lyase family enzyme
MDWKLEVVVLPVSDVDRAKAFYTDQVGFRCDVDHRAGSPDGSEFRVVQLTPPGSACSVTLMRNDSVGQGTAGAIHGLHLIVSDIEAAQKQLADAKVAVDGPFHFGERGQTDGLHPERADYGSFLSFKDPDANTWLVQEVRSRA